MITRYRIVRGKRASDEPLPNGIRQDTRKHTRHVLRPDPGDVSAFLKAPSEATFGVFRTRYLATLGQRFAADRTPFDALAALGREQDVYLGCNCPTVLQPNVRRCHTSLALEFLRRKYPDLVVVLGPE